MKNLRAVFQCLRKARLKLSIAKSLFGVQEVDFLGRKIITNGVALKSKKLPIFSKNSNSHDQRNHFNDTSDFGTTTKTRNYILKLAERLTPFFQLLKTPDAKAKIPITPDITKEFTETNECFDRSCQLARRQPLPGKQLVLMTDASFQPAGYAVLIEDDSKQKYTSTRKIYPPIAYGSKTNTPSQIKISIYAKNFLAIYLTWPSKKLDINFGAPPNQ